MSMVYQDQHPEDLNLVIAQGELAMSQFTRLAIGQHQFSPNLKVEATIIGASHCIAVTYGQATVYEVCACVGVQEEECIVTKVPIPKARALELALSPTLYYDFRSVIVAGEQGKTLVADVAHELPSAPIGLAFDFPQQGSETPKTLIAIQGNGKEVRFRTIHSYPNQDRVVMTQTFITVGGRR